MWSASIAAALGTQQGSERVSSLKHNSGWNEAALVVRRGALLVLRGTSMSVASMSNVTGAEPAATPRRAHTPARTPAIAAHRSSLV